MARTLGGFMPGARGRRGQIVTHADWWAASNRAAVEGTGPLWIVLGDSTSQAVGCADPDRGYVGGVRRWLTNRDGVGWRVVNLSRSGDTAIQLVEHQLPRLARLLDSGVEATLVSCAVGVNDLIQRVAETEAALVKVATAMPTGSLLADIPKGFREGKARLLNSHIHSLAITHNLRLVPLWEHTGAPWAGKYAADKFHPNEQGYTDWTAAFCAALT